MTSSAIQSGASTVREQDRRQWILLLILALPSIYVLLTLPPLWRDSDGFNEVASTFAPKGIIHWLPGYCLGARLILLGAGIVGSLLGGHGIPYLSISITPLNNVGIYTLIVVQHLFLVFSLFYVVSTLSSRFLLRAVFATFLALTPWVYVYANCVGSEAFSNPLIYLISAYGWKCLRANEFGRERVLLYFVLLVGAALTRQINALLAFLLPLALLPLTIGELIHPGAPSQYSDRQSRFYYAPRFLVFIIIGLCAIGTSVLVQQGMCWLFRVPFRSTFGETFEWRLSYLNGLSEQARTKIVDQIGTRLGDPVTTESLEALNRSLNQGDNWTDMFLFYKIDEILVRSGFGDMQLRTWQGRLVGFREMAAVHANGSGLPAVCANGLATDSATLPEIWTIERARFLSTRCGLLQRRLEADSLFPYPRRNSHAGYGLPGSCVRQRYPFCTFTGFISERRSLLRHEYDRTRALICTWQLPNHLLRRSVLSTGVFAFSDGHDACRIDEL
jgi:hypothetical protein